MSKAHAEDWNGTRKIPDDAHRYPGLSRGAGTGRDNNCARIEVDDIANAEGMIPNYPRCCTKPVEIAGNI